MVTVKINIKPITDLLQAKLNKLADREYLLRPVAADVIDLMTRRIHIQGIASDGNQISTYSKGYLKLREKKYHRDADPKVIISLTRQLENDWSVIATQRGYAIGFLNSFNFSKSQWVQETYKKRIFDMTSGEYAFAIERINQLTSEAIQ